MRYYIGRNLIFAYLRVIGCLCYAKVVNELDKLNPRSNMTVHLGYSMTQKGYVLYDLDKKKVLVSRDVAFKEDVFPFKTNTDVSFNKLYVLCEVGYSDRDDIERSVLNGGTTSQSLV